MRRLAATLSLTALAVTSLIACGDDDGTQAPTTGRQPVTSVVDTDSPFPGRADSFDPEDPNSLCFGASPDIPSPYEGCPGYSPEQESVAKNLPPSPPTQARPTFPSEVPPAPPE